MNFTIYGPYEIPRDGNLITRDRYRRRQFWDVVDAEEAGLSEAIGCYIFSIRGIPWYAGSAQRQDFKHECFSAHKITQFDAALGKGKGRAFLHLIARKTPRDRFCKTTRREYRDVDFLENSLIGMALRRNPELQNVRGTAFLRDMHVPGVVNNRPGEARADAVRGLRGVLGID
jgi:hypothetical protein